MKVMFVQRSKHLTADFCYIVEELKKNNHTSMIISEDEYFNINTKPVYEQFKQKYYSIGTFGKSIKHIILDEKPSIIVVGHDCDMIMSLFIKYANKYHIPSIAFQEGFMDSVIKEGKVIDAPRNETESISQKIHRLQKIFFILNLPFTLSDRFRVLLVTMKEYIIDKPFGLGKTQKILVMGNNSKKILLVRGVNENKIIITGNPRFDQIIKKKFTDVRKKYNIQENNFLVIIANQCFVEDHEWTEKKRKDFIVETLKKLDTIENIKIIFKLHPRETDESFKKIQHIIKENQFKNTIVIAQEDTYNLLNACDILITIRSTITLEALVLKKLSVGLNFLNNWTTTYYDRFQSVKGCNSYDELYEYIVKIKTEGVSKELQKKMEDDISEYLFKVDKKTANRIVSIMENMLGVKNDI